MMLEAILQYRSICARLSERYGTMQMHIASNWHDSMYRSIRLICSQYGV